MKKLFKNYDFEFDKNERKILTAFCKKIITQIPSQPGSEQYRKTFESITAKLNSSESVIKFTKDEKTKLLMNLKENINFFEKEIKKSGFIKKWIYKSMHKQYQNLIIKHFDE